MISYGALTKKTFVTFSRFGCKWDEGWDLSEAVKKGKC